MACVESVVSPVELSLSGWELKCLDGCWEAVGRFRCKCRYCGEIPALRHGGIVPFADCPYSCQVQSWPTCTDRKSVVNLSPWQLLPRT